MNAAKNSLYLTRPDLLLRLEALVALIVGCIAYQRVYSGHWGLFALLFLAPDVALLSYLRPGGKGSAAFYNLLHSYVFPLVVGMLGWARGWPLAGQLALIWLSHISFDRALGYGLKFRGLFRYTHIQSSASVEPPAVLN